MKSVIIKGGSVHSFLEDLRQANHTRGVEWCGEAVNPMDELEFRVLELGGEVGEAQNVCKKYARTRKDWRGGISYEDAREKLKDELADILICVDRVAELFNIDLESSTENKFNKTSDKNGLETKL